MVHLLARFLAAIAVCATFTTHAAPGNLDTTFGSGTGKIITAIGSGEDTARALAVQPDGKIVVAGSCSNRSDNDFCLARYDANGVLDAGFNPNASAAIWSVAVQADGKILLGGTFTSMGGTGRNYIARVMSDGTLDSGFNPNPNNWQA